MLFLPGPDAPQLADSAPVRAAAQSADRVFDLIDRVLEKHTVLQVVDRVRAARSR
jgi:hypothetical protein